MKFSALLCAGFLFSNSLVAQWTLSGTNIYNSNTGNVGVGVVNPQAKLEIVNSPNSTLRVGIVGNRANTNIQMASSAAVIADNSSSTAGFVATAWDFYNNGTSPSWAGAGIQHSGTAVAGNLFGVPAANQGTLLFQNTANAVIATNGVTTIHISPNGAVNTQFLSNGMVKIGNVTTPAGYKLFVEQGILTAKVKVAVPGTANWSDYVFDNDYTLMQLEDLEKFIAANKHLPGIPSATEVVREGIDLGDMSSKLLAKIEELTLYVIELKKENEAIKNELKILSTR